MRCHLQTNLCQSGDFLTEVAKGLAVAQHVPQLNTEQVSVFEQIQDFGRPLRRLSMNLLQRCFRFLTKGRRVGWANQHLWSCEQRNQV